MAILNTASPGELEKRTIERYTPLFFQEYMKCKEKIDCKRFDIEVSRDIDAGPIERTFKKCARDKNLNLEINTSEYYGNIRETYTFSFA